MDESLSKTIITVIKYIIFPVILTICIMEIFANGSEIYVTQSSKMRRYTEYVNNMEATEIKTRSDIPNRWPFKDAEK